MQTSKGLVSITPKKDRVIRTEPVLMSDGRIHGVHVWSGPADGRAAGATDSGPAEMGRDPGVATDTAQSLANMGRNVEMEDPEERGVRGVLAVG